MFTVSRLPLKAAQNKEVKTMTNDKYMSLEEFNDVKYFIRYTNTLQEVLFKIDKIPYGYKYSRLKNYTNGKIFRNAIILYDVSPCSYRFVLYSFDKPIMMYENGNFFRLSNEYNATIKLHLKNFCDFDKGRYFNTKYYPITAKVWKL